MIQRVMTETSRNEAIRAVIHRLEQDPQLNELENFVDRVQASDLLELQLLDDAEPNAGLAQLQQRAEALKAQWAEADKRFFAHLLRSIRAKDFSVVRRSYRETARQVGPKADEDYLGYDELDVLTNGLLDVARDPAEPHELERGMVYYQPTPTRIILKLIDELHPTSADTFYDLGSGLGHVPILVNLLAGIQTRGIEIDPSYVSYSLERMKKLQLRGVEFINADVREVDLSDGTIFYLYTPFQGEVLREALEKLEAQALGHSIRVCTYGACTWQAAKQPWLQPVFRVGEAEGSLGIFESRV